MPTAHARVMDEVLNDQPMRPTDVFGLLHLKPRDELTDDERASLTYYQAYDDVILGYAPNNAPRRWVDMSMRVARLAAALNRLPTEGAISAELAWIAEQQNATDLNSFQRARLQEIVGWPREELDLPKPPPMPRTTDADRAFVQDSQGAHLA